MSGPLLLCADLGGTWLRVALGEEDGSIGREVRVPTAHGGPELVLAQISSAVESLLGNRAGSSRSEARFAIAVPGPVDAVAGVVHSAPNLPGWFEVPLRALLEERLGCPCWVEHDATAAALAEHRRGAGRGTRNFAYVTVSTGIGAGFILEGAVYRGSHGTAGEFGHSVVVPDGPLCGCGNRGCLEAVASGTAIARDGHVATAREVELAAQRGDPKAAEVLQRAGRHIGRALGGLMNLLDPDAIAVGGGVMRRSGMVWPAAKAAVAEGSFASVRSRCRLLRAALGEEQGLVGSLELAAGLEP